MRVGNWHHHIHHGTYRWRRWNVNNVWVMAITAMLFVGCVISLGVMGLHRIRDSRIHTLSIKEKDDQILSLQLLLQKEKDRAQEIKRKTEEMKIKMYNLRTRNTELNGRLSDMQSTISSLKDEQRTIELHLHEKQNEATSALTEIVRQKEAEIEDLKHNLQLCAKVESTNKNEPSIIAINETVNENREQSESRRPVENRKDDSDGTENRHERNEKIQQMEKDKNEHEAVVTNGNLGTYQEQKPREEDKEANSNAGVGKISNSDQESDNREITRVRKGGVKLEMLENSNDERFPFGGKRGFLKRAKGKRWKRAFAKRKEAKVEKGKEEIVEKGEDKRKSSSSRGALRGYDESNNGENSEEIPQGIKLENSTKSVDDNSGRIMEGSEKENLDEGSAIRTNTSKESGQSKGGDHEEEDQMDETEF